MPGKKKGGARHADADAAPLPPAGTPLPEIFAALVASPSAPCAALYASALRDGGFPAQWAALETLAAALGDKKDPAARRAGCMAVKHAVHACGRPFEPVAVRLLPTLLDLLSDKSRLVVQEADAAEEAILNACYSRARPAPAAHILPRLLPAMSGLRWEAREAALDAAAAIAERAPEQTATVMPELVPLVVEALTDTKPGVRESAAVVLRGLFVCVTNRDFTPFKPQLLAALGDPALVPSCITAMASTTFVSTVCRPELALVVPLLVRGFRERGAELTPMIRKCARITENLSRLVEEPAEAELMLPLLVPSLMNATEVVADKECRGVCEGALEQLKRIQKALDERKEKDDPVGVAAMLRRISVETKPKGDCQQASAEYAATLCAELARMEISDPIQWRLHLLPLVWWMDGAAGSAGSAAGDAPAAAGEEREVVLAKPNTSPGLVLGNDHPGGLELKQVKPGTPGASAGLAEFAGRRITHLNGQLVRSMQEVKAVCAGQTTLLVRFAPSTEAVAAAAKAQLAAVEAGKVKAAAAVGRVLKTARAFFCGDDDDDDEIDDDGELCNCPLSLAYGTTILLHNTRIRLHKGVKYGLLGPNDCGKTTLMKAIVNGQLDGFPTADELRTVYVEADIQGELSHLSCLEYLMADPKVQTLGVSETVIAQAMEQIGFSSPESGAGGKVARINDPVSCLSGGWRMKLALARAMLQKAQILLMDEPTNHLDVMNRAWVRDYLLSLKETTCIIVSHDTGFLDETISRVIEFKKLKLKVTKGNITEFVRRNPDAASYFELKGKKGFRMKFPQPEGIESEKGGKSCTVKRGLSVMTMDGVTFTYPGNPKPTVRDVTVRVSMSSRIAVVGPNGAGKSTMIRLLTGEREARKGNVWKHPNARIAYVAQHAFHHIERHLEKTANEYLRWRYEWGDDKEGLGKETRLMTAEEEEELKQVHEWNYVDVSDVQCRKRTARAQILSLTGGRRQPRKGRLPYEYECNWVGGEFGRHGRWEERGRLDTSWVNGNDLGERGWKKPMKVIDDRVAALKGRQDCKVKVTSESVEQHLDGVGLSPEFATHHQMKTLSGGQKVKVVLAASTWDRPHIIILDEPTNYLDRETLGALADAIRAFEGGVVIVSHNNQFCKELCPETWVVERQADGTATVDCQGNPEWMQQIMREREEMAAGGGDTGKMGTAQVALGVSPTLQRIPSADETGSVSPIPSSSD